MKILKKAKILPCECERCGSIFQPNWKDVRHGDFTYCPMCGVPTPVNFKKGADNDKEKLKKKIAELEDKLRSAHIEHMARNEGWLIDLLGAKETADKAVKLAEEKTKEADEWKAKYLVGLMRNIELAERIKGADNEQREAD